MSLILPAGKYDAILFNSLEDGKEMHVYALISSNVPFDLAYLAVPDHADWERVRILGERFGCVVRITVGELKREREEISDFLYGRLIAVQP
jgi:hypothetical protein